MHAVRGRRPLRQPPLDLTSFLPPPGWRGRWGAAQKAAVVLATRNGTLTRNEACDRYLLSAEELEAWEEAFDRDGLAGLQAKALSHGSRTTGKL